MTDDMIDYPQLIDASMRGVVRDVLRKVMKTGLPGAHHFYISFRTDYPTARVSDVLRARYPQEMTIVMQHQFWDFRVDEQEFTVTLSFGGVPEKLVIPFAALTAFADPSIKFGLQFQAPASAPILPPPEDDEEEHAEPQGAAEIISLDMFRKK